MNFMCRRQVQVARVSTLGGTLTMKMNPLAWSSRFASAAMLGCLLGTFSPNSNALAAAKSPKRVLVVSTTTGFRHSSIETAERVIAELGQKSGAFTVDYVHQPEGKPSGPQMPKPLKANATEAEKQAFKVAEEKFNQDQAAFEVVEAKWMGTLKQALMKLNPESLKNYDAVIFANTTGDLPLPDRQAFLDWIKSGKGFVGMHSCADTYPGFPGFIEMMGAHFKTHGAQVEVEAINQDPKSPECRHLPATWKVYDEIYQMINFDRSKVHGLLTLDKHPNNKTPGDYPIAWCKNYGKGRVFYTSLGHREDVWDPDWKDGKGQRKNSPEIAVAYQQHILGGIKWSLGLVRGSAKPQVAK